MTRGRKTEDGRQKQLFIGVVSVLCLLSSVFAASLSDQAEAAWSQRDQPGMTIQAATLWGAALKENPNQPELYILMTKAYGRAVRHTSDPADRERYADLAREYGAEAVKRNSFSADAYAYYGEALGQWANEHKGIGSLGTVHKAVQALQKAISINPQHAFAHMVLAEFYRQAPRYLSVGDKALALEHATLAVQYGPGYAINHLVLARANLDLGKKQEAIAELQKVMTLSPPPDAIPETHADQETASKMLQSLGAAPVAAPCGDNAAGACTEQKP